MKRVKKLYSLNETTINYIKKYAQDFNISESWALDQIIANYERMMLNRKRSNKETNQDFDFDKYWKDYTDNKKTC